MNSVLRFTALMIAMGLIGASPALAGPATATDKVVKKFMALDRDGSEGVSWSEYMDMVQARARQRFIHMDANRDGEVNEEEFRSFWRREKTRWYRLSR